MVAHDTIHGHDLGTINLILNSLLLPTYLVNQDLFGKYGSIPNKYVVFGDNEYMNARYNSVSFISENGGLNHIAFPLSLCVCRKKDFSGE